MTQPNTPFPGEPASSPWAPPAADQTPFPAQPGVAAPAAPQAPVSYPAPAAPQYQTQQYPPQQYPTQAGYGGQPPYGGQPLYATGVPGGQPPQKTNTALFIIIGLLVTALVAIGLWYFVISDRGRPPATTQTSAATATTTRPPATTTTTTGGITIPSVPASLPTEIGAAAVCSIFALTLLFDPEIIGLTVNFGSSATDISEVVGGAKESFESIQSMNPPSTWTEPLETMVGLLGGWQASADSGDLAGTKALFTSEKDQYAAAFAAFKAAGEATCG